MFAKIIPVQKLRAGLDFFDYSVEETLREKIKIGQLIKVPFKHSIIFGVVLSIEKNDTTIPNIKKISNIVIETPLFEESQLKSIIQIAHIYGVSASVILKMSLPPIQTRKLSKIKLKQTQSTFTLQSQKTFYLYENEQNKKEILCSLINGKTLIIVPEKDDIETNAEILKDKYEIVKWHSDLSPKEKFEEWFKTQEDKPLIIIATRGGIFLPISNLSQIIIDKEYHEGHKHWDQNPRFHTKDIANIINNNSKIPITYLSPFPSSSVYFLVHKNLCTDGNNSKEKINHAPKMLPTVINMADERRAKNFDFLAEKVKEILPQIKGNIFFYINKKGMSRYITCEDCGYTEKCTKCTIPLVYHESTKSLHCHYCKTQKINILNCAKCESTNLKNIGIGTEAVAKEITKNTNKKVILIEKDTEKIEFEKNQIIVGTSAAFKQINWKKTDLIVFLNIDSELNIPEYNALEKVWNTIQETQYNRNSNSLFFIQTYAPEHFMFRSLNEPDRFYRMDLNMKKNLKYPPYSFLIKIMIDDVTEKGSLDIAQTLVERLTKSPFCPKIIGPLGTNPPFYRNKFWQVVILKKELNENEKGQYNIYEDLEKICRIIPYSLRIDPNPINLLSP